MLCGPFCFCSRRHRLALSRYPLILMPFPRPTHRAVHLGQQLRRIPFRNAPYVITAPHCGSLCPPKYLSHSGRVLGISDQHDRLIGRPCESMAAEFFARFGRYPTYYRHLSRANRATVQIRNHMRRWEANCSRAVSDLSMVKSHSCIIPRGMVGRTDMGATTTELVLLLRA